MIFLNEIEGQINLAFFIFIKRNISYKNFFWESLDL